jgi:pyrimidine nucleoside transport protein
MLAAYTSLGAESSHLITSSCMAAPTALAFAKMFYPETKQTKTSSDTIVHYKR